MSVTALDDIAPVITHTPKNQANYGSSFILKAEVSDNVQVESVSVKIRHKGDAAYQTRPLVSFVAGQYSVFIEGSYTTQDFEYFLLAIDDTGNQTRYADGNNPVQVSVALPDDGDIDGDGVLNGVDVFPHDANESLDSDNDGTGNNADTDDDNDGVVDTKDSFPFDSTESKDTDTDGVGNNRDSDTDNDGMPNSWELAYSLNPLSSKDAKLDADSDGVTNVNEYRLGTDPRNPDTDGDGITDDLDSVAGSGLWGYVCNAINSPSASRRWGVDLYNAADLPDATANPVFSMDSERLMYSGSSVIVVCICLM